MQTDQQQILTLLIKMRSSQVHEAQQKLMSMVNSVQYINKIIAIIQNPYQQSWIKTIACSFVNRVICQKLQQFGYKPMFALINYIMSSYNILSSDKRYFQRSLITLIQYIKEPDQIDQWRNFILKHISNPNLFDTGLLLISCTAIAQIQSDYLVIIIQQTFQATIQAVSISIQTAMIVNELMKNWIVVFDKLKAVSDQNDSDFVPKLLNKICSSQSLAKLIFSVYQFNSPKEIWLCVDPQLYELNLLKYEATQMNRRVAQYAIDNKIGISKCPCLQIIIQSYNTIKNTIAVVGANNNLQLMQNYQCQDFLTSLISLLIIYVKGFDKLTQQQMNILQHLVCFPFLNTRQQQQQIFQQSPQQFNTLAQDLCDKQTFGILKSEAARLLQAISDYCKPALEKSILYCIQCIKISMGYIPKFDNDTIKILNLQSAFQILGIYSFSLQHYPQHLQSLKIILCDKRLMKATPLQLSKVFLFLAYNYGEIFKNPSDGSFWIDFALSYRNHPTARYMALDFISNIVDEYFTQGFFNQIVKLIIQGLPRQSGQIWNIVKKLFQTQKQKINENLCLNLVNTVFKRIQRQISQLQNKQKQQTINLINAIHVLRRIIQQKQYISNKQALRNRIFDIAIIYKKSTQLNLQDQIVKILVQYAKMDEQGIRQKIFNYLPQILAQFQKQGFHQKPYFILLNQLIVKSKFNFVQPIIKSLCTGLMYHLFDMSPKAKQNKMKVSIANLLTLFQNLLSIHGYEMSGTQNDCLLQIGAMCIRLFPSMQGQKIFSKGLLAKALNLMFICHLYSKTQNTIDYLIQYAKQKIFHRYDAFVLIKLLSKAVFVQNNVNIVIQFLNLMIDITNEQQQNEKKGNSIKTAKGKLKIKRQQQLSDILFKITSPFIDFQYKKNKKTLPIKKQVIQCINKMKSNNLDTYKLIIMNMNQQQKTKLTKIINQTYQVQGKKRLIRKVIGVRTNNHQINKEENNSDIEQNQQQEENNFKRKRVLQKKKQTKKTKESKINDQ